ncbi:unnamed protein product [Ixodes hexagonus]
MEAYNYPPMPTEMRARVNDLLEKDGLHLVYNVPVEPQAAWKQKLGFTIRDGVNVTFVMFLRDTPEFRVNINDYHDGSPGYVEMGTFGALPRLQSRKPPNVGTIHVASSNPLGKMQYFTCGFQFAGTNETKGYINETLISTHQKIDLDVLDEIYVHANKQSHHFASMISIHVTGKRDTVDQFFSNQIPDTRLAQNFAGTVMTVLGVYNRESAASNDKIQVEVYERGSPDGKVRLEVDPGTIDKTDKLIQIKFGHGSVTVEGPGGRDMKPTTFAGLTKNCAAQIVHNFQVKRVTVESYLFKDPRSN